MAPIIAELRKRNIPQAVCVTGQHREMLDQVLEAFDITPDHDLEIMQSGQTLEQITSRSLEGLTAVIKQEKPSFVLVQGDTTSAFAGGLAAFYHQIPLGHVEAGLRTHNKYNPFPEEMNRRLLSSLADVHFAATDQARDNLLAEGIAADSITVTGNTVIDALLHITKGERPYENESLAKLDTTGKRIILVTAHRRENLGADMQQIFAAIKRLANDFADLLFIFPVHLNPTIQAAAAEAFASSANVFLTSPLGYSDLAQIMKRSYLVLTDSGGIQEEAPALGKPVLVLRQTTERPEGIEAGTAKLVGTDTEAIYQAANELLTDEEAYAKMAKATNPYGDGTAAQRIVSVIEGFKHE
jgi:UDP-N-acetylglucosamine 2-epimerase (non-hydrolysing)